MSRYYRLVKAEFSASPIDGEGARLYGGRWNSAGTALVYASTSISLAMLEILVNSHEDDALQGSMLCSIEIDDGLTMRLDGLPSGWNAPVPSIDTVNLGDSWVASRQSVGLLVPSSVVASELNILINPNHPDFSGCTASIDCNSFEFDSRLLN